jgi:catechol 2,3-dioxygenase-like lactoylglutathione lyase family enzyme
MPTLHQITPFVPVKSLDKAVDFYSGYLNFDCTFKADNYAFLRHDQVAIRIVQVDDNIDLSVPERQNSFYIDVTDIDALYEGLADKLETLPQGRVRAPFNQDYGQREFHVIDEDCTLIFFGEGIKQT